jgi:heptosyltransferase-1
MAQRFLIVRLGALGDIIHALPVAAALREAFADARVDWLVSSRHRAILRHVPVVNDTVVVEPGRGAAGRGSLIRAITRLRRSEYDAAFDLQGLIKSAVLARSSGAQRVIGFSTEHLRERWAHVFYTETVEPPAGVHVTDKNLALLGAVGLHDLPKRFPLEPVSTDDSTPGSRLRRESDRGDGETGEQGGCVQALAGVDSTPFALINPNAGWPNKRWPPEWYGDIARRLREKHDLRSVVLWGPGEESLARIVVRSSGGAAALAEATDISALMALARSASLFISGDTGPLHIAAAVGTPVVGIYGPTNPARNGPWDPDDVCVSRFDRCQCHHRRRCRLPVCCLLDITVDDVMAAIDRRLSTAVPRSPLGQQTGPRAVAPDASPAATKGRPDA